MRILPKISVITRTCAGRERFLREAMQSVQAQAWGNIEHIIVQDGGASQQKICDEFTESGNVRFIACDKIGRSAAGNVGLTAATGEYCLFLDDDDRIFPNHLAVLMAAIMSKPESVAAYSVAKEVVTFINPKTGKYCEIIHRIPAKLRQEYDYAILCQRNFMAIQSVLFRRSLFLERGGLDPLLDTLEDWNLWVRYGYGQHFVYVPEVTSLFRTPANLWKRWQRIIRFKTAYRQVKERNRIACLAESCSVSYGQESHGEK